MSSEEKIYVEEDDVEENSEVKKESVWWDEIKVSGEEVVETVKRIAQEAGVRRIVVQNRHGKVLIKIPLLLGLTGIVLLPTYAALALVGGLVADCTILVERQEGETQEAA